MEPEKPDPSDCCGSGCSPCVFDIYEQRLKCWRENQLNEDISCRRDLLSETRFKPFHLVRKEQLIEDLYLYCFRPVINNIETNEISGFLPYEIGQHLVLKCDLNFENGSYEEKLNNFQPNMSETECAKTLDKGNHQITTRSYTPLGLSKQEKDCCFKIFAKLYRNGIGSEYLRKLQVGDICFWRGPYGEFSYKPNSFKYIFMFCVGSGLAPMLPIIDYILNNDSDETILHLSYGVKCMEHVIMRERLRQMAQYWNFNLEYFFSDNRAANNSLKFGENFKNKRIDQSSVRDCLDGKDFKMLLVLICGTDSFTLSTKNVVSDLGIDPKNIFVF